MLNLEDLEQFVAFHEYGTLTEVAERFHTSQPSVTRTMKRVEDSFGLPLFDRSANRISFNNVGEEAVKAAASLLASADKCVRDVKEFHRRMHTITVLSCAPAPLWTLLPELTRQNPGITISSRSDESLEQIAHSYANGDCDMMVLPYPLELPDSTCTKMFEEHLSICVKPDHALAGHDTLTMEEINGYNCLLFSDIGFWTNLCKKHMPSSKFLVQTDRFTFDELVRESNLPCFTTNMTDANSFIFQSRIAIPITDPDVNVTYYLIRHEK